VTKRFGTEPVAVATGLFQRNYPLATASGSVPCSEFDLLVRKVDE